MKTKTGNWHHVYEISHFQMINATWNLCFFKQWKDTGYYYFKVEDMLTCMKILKDLRLANQIIGLLWENCEMYNKIVMSILYKKNKIKLKKFTPVKRHYYSTEQINKRLNQIKP